MKFKVKVKNPNTVVKGGLDIRVVSNYARYIYEYKNLADLFETNVTSIFCGSAKYLWGLSKSTRTPCPVRTYLSKGIAVWNKITFNFYPNLTFPSCFFFFFIFYYYSIFVATQGFKFDMDVQAVNYVNDMSIWTDCDEMTGYSLKCATDTVNKFISCYHIG